MANVIAFFPWAFVQSPVSVGPLRLLPYQRGVLPGNLPHVTQTDIDCVLSAYAERPNCLIEKGALLEWGEWHSGMDMPDEQVALMQRASHLLAFSALSRRSLFNPSSTYTNSHTYRLVLQQYLPGDSDTIAFSTRRRDFGGMHFWNSEEFALHRPIHVDGRASIAIDESLLKALIDLPDSHARVYAAVVEFNLANTDSNDVPPHAEVVMCKSAFEWLLKIDSNAKSFVRALQARLAGIEATEANGPLVAKWNNRWQDESRLLDAWAKDFCAVRGTSAHGVARPNFVWSDRDHLAFVAIFFPLLVKKVLADDKLLTLGLTDAEHLRRIEMYLAHEPFDFSWKPYERHPWAEVQSSAGMAVTAKILSSGMS